jgi:hypothetical protein
MFGRLQKNIGKLEAEYLRQICKCPLYYIQKI